ncbi:MAG: hypothetical protein WCC60_07890 [Ilumatobacteraceae bacterium]
MHIQSEDGYFGVGLTPALSRGFFVFMLRFGDRVLGDGQPAGEYASVAALADLKALDDPRIDPDLHSPTAILDFLTSDDWLDVDDEHNLYDLTLPGWGESMDAYSTRAYLWGNEAIFLFREHNRTNDPDSWVWDEALLFRVDRVELAAIAAAALAALRAFDAAR